MDGIEKVAEIRREKGMTQEQLSKASGVHRVTIARIESGEISTKAETLKRIADALGVRMDDLIGG